MWISKYFVFFIIFSCLGWIWESIYCSVKNKKWENRGFLLGPICPIYGVGSVAGVVLVDIIKIYSLPQLSWWQIFIISFFVSILLEYSTHWALEKLFHAYWWDYSDAPFNIKGRICLSASLGFGGAGVLIVFVLVPFCEKITANVPPALLEAVSLIFMSLFAADLTLTVSALTDFQKRVMSAEKNFQAHMTDAFDYILSQATSNSMYNMVIRRIEGLRYSGKHQARAQQIFEKLKNINKKNNDTNSIK